MFPIYILPLFRNIHSNEPKFEVKDCFDTGMFKRYSICFFGIFFDDSKTTGAWWFHFLIFFKIGSCSKNPTKYHNVRITTPRCTILWVTSSKMFAHVRLQGAFFLLPAPKAFGAPSNRTWAFVYKVFVFSEFLPIQTFFATFLANMVFRQNFNREWAGFRSGRCSISHLEIFQIKFS